MQVLIHWACAKIAAAPDEPDDKLMAALDAKLKAHRGMQYAAIAAHARTLGRTSLAAALLDREPRASEQVGFQGAQAHCCCLAGRQAHEHVALRLARVGID